MPIPPKSEFGYGKKQGLLNNCFPQPNSFFDGDVRWVGVSVCVWRMVVGRHLPSNAAHTFVGFVVVVVSVGVPVTTTAATITTITTTTTPTTTTKIRVGDAKTKPEP